MKKIITLIIVVVNILYSVNAQNKLNPGDTLNEQFINFDDTTNLRYIHLDTSAQNLWQIGSPHKNIFSSAFSAPNAIVTDTINYYPINNHSYFDLYIGNFNIQWYPYDIFIDFRHKFDSDTLKDGGYITVSWDKGLTWMNIINDTTYQNIGGISPGFSGFSTNIYTTSNTLYNGEYGFSGRSNGWIYTCIQWVVFPVKFSFPPDTLIIRFNFISDSINNPKEGWMIDRIKLFMVDFGSDIKDIYRSSNLIFISPNPFTQSTQITLNQTYHSIALAVYDIQGKQVAQQQYADCDKIQLSRNQLSNGLYFLKLTLDDKAVETGKIVISDE